MLAGARVTAYKSNDEYQIGTTNGSGNITLPFRPDSTGTLTVGASADLVVLDADPLADIRNVRRIALVVRRGEIYTRRELEYP